MFVHRVLDTKLEPSLPVLAVRADFICGRLLSNLIPQPLGQGRSGPDAHSAQQGPASPRPSSSRANRDCPQSVVALIPRGSRHLHLRAPLPRIAPLFQVVFVSLKSVLTNLYLNPLACLA